MNTAVEIQFFGFLIELTGTNLSTQQMEESISVEELTKLLISQYPKLNNAEFRVAVNRELANPSDLITPNDEVALLPPFAGG